MKNNNNNHSEKKKKFVLQYSFCIAERKRIEGCLYCNTIFCIVIEACVN